MSGVFITYEYKTLKYEFLKTVLPIKTIYIFNDKMNLFLEMIIVWIILILLPDISGVWLTVVLVVFDIYCRRKEKKKGVEHKNAPIIYKDGDDYILEHGGRIEKVKIIEENWQKYYIDSNWQRYKKTF